MEITSAEIKVFGISNIRKSLTERRWMRKTSEPALYILLLWAVIMAGEVWQLGQIPHIIYHVK